MDTFRRNRLLISSLLILTVVWVCETASPSAAEPPLKPDFTIQTHETADVWFGDTVGTWRLSGVESDSGTVGGLHGCPTAKLWLEGGDLGVIYLETHCEVRTFEVLYGTGIYESWVGATGTYTIAYGRERNGYRAVRRKLEGFLPAAP